MQSDIVHRGGADEGDAEADQMVFKGGGQADASF